MKNIDIKAFFKKNWVHFLAVGLFLLITVTYFSPQFNGFGLKQHDIEQFKGMSHEVAEHREMYGEEPLWTNAMFGGMPTYQISTKYDGNWISKIPRFLNFGMKSPAGIFIMYMLGFYIMLMCMKINRWVAIFGAISFAFASYNLIILQAGHNSKAMALALAPPVIGAFYLAFRRNVKWGILLSALFMSIEIGANHLQITYYLGILLLFMGVIEFIRIFTKNIDFKKFGFATGGLIVAYLFAVGINYGNISLTNDYAKYTIRGANDIKVNPDGTMASANQSAGLDKDYITQWSYGIGETFTLAAPYAKGGGSKAIAEGPFKDKLKDEAYKKDANLISGSNLYWGNQPITTGPVYIGIIVLLLAFLALFVVKDKIKWALLGATILCVMLSWGKNYMGLTEFFIDHIPGYNKFRAVTIILAIVEITVPLLGVLFLNYIIKNKEELTRNINIIAISGGAFLVVLLIIGFVGIGDNFSSDAEKGENYAISMAQRKASQYFQTYPPERLAQIFGGDPNSPNFQSQVIQTLAEQEEEALMITEEFRADVFQSTFLVSFLFGLLALGLVLLFAKLQFKYEFLVVGLLALTLIDLVLVDVNYLSNAKQENSKTKYKFWVDDIDQAYPMNPNQADMMVFDLETKNNPELLTLINKEARKAKQEAKGKFKKGLTTVSNAKKFAVLNMNTNYRVYEPQGGFSSSRASYFHKSIGGYHGAKLRNINNLSNFQFSLGNYKVFDMLNVKYFLTQDRQTGAPIAQQNRNAMGNAWLVKNLEIAESPEKEIRSLGKEVQIANVGSGKLLVNSEPVNDATVYGLEDIKYVIGKDTASINIQQTFRTDVMSSYVVDVNGNQNWVPNSTLLADSTNSFKALISTELKNNFEPNVEAIVSNETAKKVGGTSFSGEGSILMTNYKPNHLTYEVNVPSDQFAVFSEIYYPDGWNAYIDGNKVEIEKANYLLRGLKIPAGAKKVEMKFEVEKFKTVNTVALVMGLILAGLIMFFLVGELKKR